MIAIVPNVLGGVYLDSLFMEHERIILEREGVHSGCMSE